MIFALGCIQVRRCNSNTRPVGIATQEPSHVTALDVQDKAHRVDRYHRATIDSLLELVALPGLDGPLDIRPHHVSRRIGVSDIKHFGEIYEFLSEGSLLQRGEVPQTAIDRLLNDFVELLPLDHFKWIETGLEQLGEKPMMDLVAFVFRFVDGDQQFFDAGPAGSFLTIIQMP